MPSRHKPQPVAKQSPRHIPDSLPFLPTSPQAFTSASPVKSHSLALLFLGPEDTALPHPPTAERQ